MRGAGRRAIVASALLVLLGARTAAGGPLPPAEALLAAHPCTVVAAVMVDSVDSSSAASGDFFRFETVNAVTIGTTVVIPARTMGWSEVVLASPAGHGGQPGVLVLEPRYLVLPDGTHLGVVLDRRAALLDAHGVSHDLPGILGAVPIPGVSAAVGLFNFFHKGANVVVPRGTIFAVFPSDDPTVERCQNHPDD